LEDDLRLSVSQRGAVKGRRVDATSAYGRKTQEEQTMKNTIMKLSLMSGALLLATFSSWSPARSTQDQSDKTEAEIGALLAKHDQAMTQKDMDALMALYAPGSTNVMMGTGPGEKWVGMDEIKDAYAHFFQDYDKGTPTHNCFWKNVASEGDVAWLTAMCQTTDSLKGKKREFGLNLSAVFVRQDGKWLIRMMHFSNLTGELPQAAAATRKKK
jgi:uncharacterized protein (TIGR02246 family)